MDELAALLGALAMGLIVLPPRRPQSKGSVERTIGYLETSFLPLRQFADLADLQAQSDAWAEASPGRGTIGASAPGSSRRSPWSAPSSRRCPSCRRATDRRLEVRVSRDGFVRVAGVDYSVPPGLVGRRVAVASVS